MNHAEILVIDDELQIRKLLEITLQTNDYKMKGAVNAKEGLQVAKNINPDLILLDLGLPDESGHVVLEKLREWYTCLLYTSDAADERSSVDLGGRRIIK